MSRFMRFGALLCVLFFGTNAFAAGYSCPTYKKYTSCTSGYYMTQTSSSTACYTTAVAGNACRPCSTMGSNYTCSGGTSCPKLNTVTCSAGYYLNGSSCAKCGGSAYYCPGGTWTPNGGAQGRNGVSSGYYTTGGSDANTRTGQTKCEAGYYCSGGVRTACSGSLQYQDGTGATSCKSVSTGYYKSSNTAQAQCDAGYRNIAATSRNECVGSFSKSGSQVDPAMPTGCAGRSLTACTPGTCTYTKKYSGTVVSDCTPSNCTKGQTCTSASANYYLASGVAKSCSSFSSTYTKSDGGNIGSGYCYVSRTKTGSQVDPAMPTGCAGRSLTACTPGTCTYKDYYSATDTTCTPSNCTKGQTCTSASANYYLASGVAKSCSSFSSTYTKSDGGNIGSGYCYVSRTKTGSQVNGSTPTNCASVTEWNACTPGTCTYKDYYSATDTTCTPSNCTKTPKTVTAKAGSYVSGASCATCSSFNSNYPNSDGGSINSNYCYASKTKTGSQVNSATPTNCYSVTAWNACTPGTCTYKDYYNATDTTCTPSNCTKTAKTTTGKSGYYGYTNGTGQACGSCSSANSTYPLSDNGATGASYCYRNQTKSGTSSNASCSVSAHGSCTYNACTPGTCTWKDYNGATDTTCTPTNCTNSVASWKINAGYYFNGTAATACAAGGYCPGITVTSAPSNGTGRTACSTLGTGYTSAGGAGDTANTRCYLPVAGGKVRSGKTGTTLSTCSAGTYKAAHNAYYNTSYSCDTCAAGTYTSTTGQSSCAACPAGKYCTGGSNVTNCAAGTYRSSTGGKAASDCSACTGVTYSGAGATSCTTCPNSATGYYRSDGVHSTVNGCYKNVSWTGSHGSGTRNCYYTSGSGTSAVYSTSCDTYRATKCAAAYYYVSGADCTSVGTGYWSAADSTGRTQCPANYRSGGAASAESGCKASCAAGTRVAAKNAACTAVTSGNVYMLAHTVNYGSTSAAATSCPSGYTISGTTQADHDAKNDCKISCGAGTRVATADATCTGAGTGYYIAAHTVSAGSTSAAATQCPANYRNGAAAGAESGCVAHCSDGQYVATAKAACTSVGTGYYRAAHNVNYGSTSTRAQCPANYRNGGATGAESGCQTSCGAGQYVATAKAACTSVGTGYYRAAHNVAYGDTSSRTQCPANYRNGAAAGTESGCQTSCGAGQYVATAKAACTSVGTGYYRAAHNVNYGSTSTRAQCPEGYRNGAATGAEGNCQMSVAAGKYVATAKEKAASGTCAAGTAKAAHTVNYGATSSCDACTGRTKYSGAGASACSTVSNGYYTTGCNSSNNNCTGQSQCTGTTYCTGGIKNECPNASTAKRTSFPDNYYSPTISSTSVQNSNGKSEIRQCHVLTWMTSPRGELYEYANYNSSTSKYDSTSSYAWSGAAAGYYLTNKAGCGSYAYYNEVKECPAGSYCPGKEHVSCNSSNQSTVHTTNFGLESCPANYENSPAKATAASQCYLNTAAGKFVKTANAAQETCTAGGYCPGGVKITYGATGGRTACAAGTANASTGSSAASACATCAAGTYNTTTGNTSCATCNAGYYCTGGKNHSACSALTGVSVSGGTYTSAAGSKESKACKYTAPSKTIAGCKTVTTNQVAYTGSAWPATTYTVSANGGYIISGNGTASATCSQCGAGKYSAGGSATSCGTCANWTYSAAGATSCTDCAAVGDGWTKIGGTGWTSYANCKGTKTGSAINANCSAGVLTRAQTNATTWGAPTITTALQAKAGAIVSGQTCAQCTGATFSAGGTETECSACPNGYDDDTSNGKSANTQCKMSVAAGKYVASANAASAINCGTGTYKVAHSVNYGSTSSCSACPDNYKSGAGTTAQNLCKASCAAGTRVAAKNAACTAITSGNVYMLAHTVNYGSTSAAATACPTGYGISGTTQADHDAKNDCKISCGAGTRVATADAACTTPAGTNWYTGAHTVSAGSTSGSNVKACLTNYATPNTTTASDHDAASDCKISCGAGTRIATANATSCTTPSGNWYVGAHTVSQGGTSSVNNCLANYTITGTAATNHDAENDCKISCGGGTYIAAARNTSCSNVGVGYWAAASTVSQGTVGTRNACASGLTTIGYGTGADEVGDCGHVLNAGGEKIYLRSTKKTTPSLNVKIGNATYYGNMSTATKGSLRIKNGSTTYSVHDDSK